MREYRKTMGADAILILAVLGPAAFAVGWFAHGPRRR
jgi:hypothetical protein